MGYTKGVPRGPMSAEHKAKLSAAQRGRPLTDEHKVKLSLAAQNRTAEHRAKLGAIHKGTTLTPEHRAKISAGNMGRVFSEESKAKISASLKTSASHQARMAIGIHRTHGASGHNAAGSKATPEYRAWCALRQRTLNPRNPNYPFYGGRGIGVCDRWNPKKGGTFQMFLDDMGLRPEWATGGLDRIDPSGDYVPSNCRWASKSMQIRNRRCSGCVSSEALLLLLLAERAQWVRS